MENQNEMDKIVTPMMEDICDHLCRFPWETERKEDLEEICAGCKMDQYTNDILNTYNSACKLQVAAETVRNELVEKCDWYDALVESIYGYLRSTDGSVPWHQMALELANQIVGIEPEQEGK